ncbi:MAG TPA: hypothetical protein VLC95_20390, partial [Anaerolineae bacterium]|nr:hypothetical protein [Anaerolineae bacterium]
DAPLSTGSYRAEVFGVTDRAGLGMEAPYAWSFEVSDDSEIELLAPPVEAPRAAELAEREVKEGLPAASARDAEALAAPAGDGGEIESGLAGVLYVIPLIDANHANHANHEMIVTIFVAALPRPSSFASLPPPHPPNHSKVKEYLALAPDAWWPFPKKSPHLGVPRPSTVAGPLPSPVSTVDDHHPLFHRQLARHHL